MILKILVWIFGAIGLNIYLDRNGTKRNYAVVFAIRGIAAILHGIWILSEKMDKIFDYGAASSVELLKIWAPILSFQISSYWIFFELGLNIVTHKPSLLYYDHQEGDSGYIDRFFMWSGPIVHALAKLIVLIILVLSTINLINNYA